MGWAAAAPLAGVEKGAVGAGTVALAAAAAGVGIGGWLGRLRAEDVDRLVEQLCPALGVAPTRSVVSVSRWSRGWPGRPGRVVVRYPSAGIEMDPGWVTRVTAVVSGQAWGSYRVGKHDPRKRRLVFEPSPVSGGQDAGAEQVSRARRQVLAMLGPTAKIVATETDPDTGELAAVEATHEIGYKLAPPGYRTRIERTVSAILPGRWRAEWDMERDWVRFEVRPAFPTSVWHPAPEGPPPQYEDVAIPYGVDEDGHVMVWRPPVDPHMMLVGSSGTGKTVTAHTVLTELAAMNWRIWVVDGKTVEFLGFRDWPNVQIVASRIEHQVAVIHRAWEEMERRYAEIENGADETDFTPLVLFLDEFADFRGNLTSWYQQIKVKGEPAQPRTIQEVASLARKGRLARIHMVFGLQRPDADFFSGRLTGDMRDNFRMRVSMGSLSPQGAMMMWDSPSVGTTIPRGCRGRATTINDQNRPVEIQAYRTPDPRKVRSGAEGFELVEILRPPQVAHERLVILEPDLEDADLDDVGSSPSTKTTDEVSEFMRYVSAPWGWASENPSADPVLKRQKAVAAVGRDGGGAWSDLLALRQFLGGGSPAAAVGTVGGRRADPVIAAVADTSGAAEVSGRRSVSDLLTAAAGIRPALRIVPDLHDVEQSVDDDGADGWVGYGDVITVSPSDLAVGDLVLVDETRGEWAVVDCEPGPDPFATADDELISVTYRGCGDSDGVLSTPADTELAVRRPLEYDDTQV